MTATSAQPIEQLMTATEVAEVLRCSVRSVYRISVRDLPVVMIGKLKRYKRTDVEAFTARARVAVLELRGKGAA